jgi:hypothetical protein
MYHLPLISSSKSSNTIVNYKNNEPIKKIMIWTFENKIHFKTFKNPYLFLGHLGFAPKILYLSFFVLMYHILSPYKISQTKLIKKIFIHIKPQIEDKSIFFNFKNPIFYIWYIYVTIFYIHVFLYSS